MHRRIHCPVPPMPGWAHAVSAHQINSAAVVWNMYRDVPRCTELGAENQTGAEAETLAFTLLQAAWGPKTTQVVICPSGISKESTSMRESCFGSRSRWLLRRWLFDSEGQGSSKSHRPERVQDEVRTASTGRKRSIWNTLYTWKDLNTLNAE